VRPETYQTLADRQQTYWWHRARRSMALSLLRRYGLASGCRWLDIGCGPGGNFSMLASLSPKLVAGIDISPIALSLARAYAPSAVLVRADINETLPFADASFDVATILNVLYHGWVRSEADVLAEVARILRPGGLLLLTEPAFDALMREMDEAVMTRRRYRDADFDPWLRAAGFGTLFSSYFTAFGVPILLGAKFLKRLHRKTAAPQTALDMRPLPGLVNETLAIIAKIEGWALTKRVRMPFGTTLVRVARRLS
jgi:SAM-dependent methyltransferase